MPLPRAAYGSEAARLPLERESSGPYDNARAADNSTDPHDTAASLAAAGRIAGYQLSFADLASVGKAGKLVGVASRLAVYRTAVAASAGLRREFDDARASDPANGFRVLSSTRFAAPGLGDEAAGIRVLAKAGLAKLWFTAVGVRSGKLIELVGLIRTDGRSEQPHALLLAHALAARVEGVLAGTITTPPAKFP